jgi:polysaccharide biosynthesis/export protein
MRLATFPTSAFLGMALTVLGFPTPSRAQVPVAIPTAVGRPAPLVGTPAPPTTPPDGGATPAASPGLPAANPVESIPLKSGDRLRLTVVGFADLSGEQSVMADGTIQLPMAGSIVVGGLESKAAVETIQAALAPYVRRPQVGLAVLSLSPLRINITGEVLQPGPRSFDPARLRPTDPNPTNTLGRPVSLSEALSLAGGITPNADLQNIVIRRTESKFSPLSRRVETTQTNLKVDLWQTLKEGDLLADVHLRDGDEIRVPAGLVGGADRKKLLISTVAPAKIVVQVVGEVQRPGQVEIAPSSGVSQAIGAAGGPTRDAKQKAIALFRPDAEGKLVSQQFDFGKDSGSLQTGDLIVVGQKGSSRFLDVLGKILSPLGTIFYLLK